MFDNITPRQRLMIIGFVLGVLTIILVLAGTR
jgi:hypothetical protein